MKPSKYKTTEYRSEYRAWLNMRSACYNADSRQYPTVGANGITVEWQTFDDFMDDMGPKPDVDFTIHRTDTSLGFTATNCRWVHKNEIPAFAAQRARRYHWDGKDYTLKEVSDYCCISTTAMAVRLAKMPMERAMTVGALPRGSRHSIYASNDIQCTCKRTHEPEPLKHAGNCRRYNTVYQRMYRERKKEGG